MKTYEKDARSGVQALVAKAQKSINALEKEKQRTECMKQYEKEYASYGSVCGIDEAGRGRSRAPWWRELSYFRRTVRSCISMTRNS